MGADQDGCLRHNFDPVGESMHTTSRLLLAAGLALWLPLAAHALVEEHQDMAGPFADGPSVTAACLECHENAAYDFMKTAHWTWGPMQDLGRKGQRPVGKKNLINNFCVAVASNWPRCTSCHAGYGWEDDSFDFGDATKVDCLICHDTTGRYKKFPTGAGHPVYEAKTWQGTTWEPLDLAEIARAVDRPSRASCGACHFQGGGGNNVKHGDMDDALARPALALDVHMSEEGQDFTCVDCHTTSDHDIAGNAMFASPGGTNHLECTGCHGEEAHEKKMPNRHAEAVACQTCHIPAFARANPTKMWWDWSTAGTDAEVVTDEYGMKEFNKKKGHFKWEKNVVPTYLWYAGSSAQYMIVDVIHPDEITQLNRPVGERGDGTSKIYPFKVMRGKQPYDTQTNELVVPKLFGKTGFWTTWDWNAAAAQGMKPVGREFSGEVGFAETESFWKINHMVAPAADALGCKDCHVKNGQGRIDWAALGYEGDPRYTKNK